MDTPSVGRIVHYVGTPGGEFPVGAHRAAIITEVSPALAEGAVFPFDGAGRIGVCVLNPSGLFFNQGIPYDETARMPGSWHWPERT